MEKELVIKELKRLRVYKKFLANMKAAFNRKEISFDFDWLCKTENSVAEIIDGAFVWIRTSEGLEFWNKLYNKLKEDDKR